MTKTKRMKIELRKGDVEKFDNALDLVFDRGWQNEVKHQPAKMIGEKVLMYSVMRANSDVADSLAFGDVLVRLLYVGGNSAISFHSCNRLEDGSLEEIPLAEILKHPVVEV